MVALGFPCCMQAFSCCSDGGAVFRRGAPASHCGGLLSRSAGVSSCCPGPPWLWLEGPGGCGVYSLGALASPACSMWNLRNQGSNPRPLHGQAGSHPRYHQRVRSNETRDRTHVLCVGRRVLIHGTTRECGATQHSPRPAATSPEILLERNILQPQPRPAESNS